MSKITLSPNHGVNPCLPICIYCGEEKNEIALLGKLPGDKEAPKNLVINYEPCDNCQAGMKTGIAFLEVDDTTHKPTGAYMVVKKESAVEFLGEDHEIIKIGKCLMLQSEFQQFFKVNIEKIAEGKPQDGNS